jgi:serine/threonine-protein kinase RsbW
MGESSSKRARQSGSTARRRTPARGTARSTETRRDFTISSDFNDARDVQKRILDDVELAGFNSQSQFAIKLALEEAMINAIKHGNRLDPDKKVRISAAISPKQAEIIIIDEGRGFSRQSVPDPTLDENLEKCSGRGIHLIEDNMTSAEWSNDGRTLKMIKKNEG